MKTIRIYSKRLAEYLTARDFKILKVIQDISRPTFSNWIFELRETMREYSQKKKWGNSNAKSESESEFLPKPAPSH